MRDNDQKQALFPLALILNPCEDWAAYRFALQSGCTFFQVFDVQDSSGYSTIAIWLEEWGETSETLCGLAVNGCVISGIERRYFTDLEQRLPLPFPHPQEMTLNAFHPNLLHYQAEKIPEDIPLGELAGQDRAVVIDPGFRSPGLLQPGQLQDRVLPLPESPAAYQSDVMLREMVNFYSCHALMDCFRESCRDRNNMPPEIRHSIGLVNVEEHGTMHSFVSKGRGTVPECVAIYMSVQRGTPKYREITDIASAVAVALDRGITGRAIIRKAREMLPFVSDMPGALGPLMLNGTVEITEDSFNES